MLFPVFVHLACNFYYPEQLFFCKIAYCQYVTAFKAHFFPPNSFFSALPSRWYFPNSLILSASSPLKTVPSTQTRLPSSSTLHAPQTPKPHFIYLSMLISQGTLFSRQISATLFSISSGPTAKTLSAFSSFRIFCRTSVVKPFSPKLPSSVVKIVFKPSCLTRSL